MVWILYDDDKNSAGSPAILQQRQLTCYCHKRRFNRLESSSILDKKVHLLRYHLKLNFFRGDSCGLSPFFAQILRVLWERGHIVSTTVHPTDWTQETPNTDLRSSSKHSAENLFVLHRIEAQTKSASHKRPPAAWNETTQFFADRITRINWWCRNQEDLQEVSARSCIYSCSWCNFTCHLRASVLDWPL